MLRKKLANTIAIWRDVIALLKFADSRLTFLAFCVALAEALLAIAALFAIKALVVAIASSSGTAASIYNSATLTALGITLGALMIGRMLASFGIYLRAKQSLLVADVVNEEIQLRTALADISFFDSSLYYDALERARESGAQRPAEVISNVLSVLRSLIMLLGTAVVIIGLEWRIVPGIAIALVLTLFVQLQATNMRFNWIKKRIQLDRRASYLDWLLTSEQFAKEIRLFNISEKLRGNFRALREEIRTAQLRIEWTRASREAVIAFIAGAVFIFSAYFIVASATDNATALSSLVILVVAFQRAEASGRACIQALSRLYDDKLFLGQLFKFLHMEPSIEAKSDATDLPAKFEDGIRLDNVTFSYPRSDKPALKNVSLVLPANKFIAIVGGNGSGKSTLIKVLLRLYDPQEGRVTQEGEDVRGFDSNAYRSQFGAVFQDFGQYALTVRDNISLGDIRAPNDGPRLEEAAKLAGAHDIIQKLPKGYDTMLARLFDNGEQLSGGQWQRIALARAFFPDSRFVILDEPTSATDPSAEAALFEGFREKLGGRSALVISHRLSTIRTADYTYVIQDGEVIEEGTHDDLVAKGGKYFSMFRSQMVG